MMNFSTERDNFVNIVILGSGTSTGVPVLGCRCSVCLSGVSKNIRTRCSAAFTYDGLIWTVIDTSPEFRIQALAAGIENINGVLFTHLHADHCSGFDDIRAYSFENKNIIPCFVGTEMLNEFESRFRYVFEDTGYKGARPLIKIHPLVTGVASILDRSIEVFRFKHGHTHSYGFRIGSFLYATDFKNFTEEQILLLQGKIDVAVLSGIHFGKHSAHSNVQETTDIINRIGAKRGIITHLSHEIDYARDIGRLPSHITFAYDNMLIKGV
jgi:phosphoribosyl 1,2-cyclic phosphate phosphodiesterase